MSAADFEPSAPRRAVPGRVPGWVMGALVLAVVALTAVLVSLGERQPTAVPVRDERPTRTERTAAAAAALRSLARVVTMERPIPGDWTEPAATVAANARLLSVSDFSLRYAGEDPGALAQGATAWTAAVEVSWSFGPADTGLVARTEVSVAFRWDGRGAVVADVGGGGRRTPLWLGEPVRVARAPGVLVLAPMGGPDPAGYLPLAVRAATSVRDALTGWRTGLVVEVPRDAAQLTSALDADPSAYQQIAAVTTTVDGSPRTDAPAHVFVNVGVFDPLSPRGKQVVLTHETTHVATGASTGSMPLWLVEGFADYVALRTVALPESVTAAQIAARVRVGGVPSRLPADAEFDAAATHLGAAYEAAWLACRILAESGSEAQLVAFYEAVRAGGDPEVELARIFGFSQQALVEAWQDRLRSLTR